MAGEERLAAFVALREGDALRLEWEPTNEYGPRMPDDETQAAAIMVFGPTGVQVGYLPATGSPTASIVARHLRAGGVASATVIECTGGVDGRENHGRNVEIMLASAVMQHA